MPSRVVVGAARVRRLEISEFRNIATAAFDVPAAGMAIVGDNGQGKTNLLEALAYLRLLRSMRGARDRDLVRFGASAFHVRAALEGASARRADAGADRSGAKRVSLDGAPITRLNDALGALPSICVSPMDAAIISGGPAERRRYLDIALALSDASYLNALRHFRAALTRRNAVLRRRRRNAAAEARAWEPALAQHGAAVIGARTAWVAAVGGRFAELGRLVGETAPMALAYESPFADPAVTLATREDELLAALDAGRETDLARGATQTGPHRDDLGISLDARDIRVVGSAGQHRSAAIVLRLLEAETQRERTGVAPVLLLDDPFAELDRRRAGAVLELLAGEATGGGAQTIICVPRPDEIPEAFTRLERWSVSAGAFAPVGADRVRRQGLASEERRAHA